MLASETIVGGEPRSSTALRCSESGDDEVDGESVTTSGDDEGWTAVPVSSDEEEDEAVSDEPPSDAPASTGSAASFIPPPTEHRDAQGVIIRR